MALSSEESLCLRGLARCPSAWGGGQYWVCPVLGQGFPGTGEVCILSSTSRWRELRPSAGPSIPSQSLRLPICSRRGQGLSRLASGHLIRTHIKGPIELRAPRLPSWQSPFLLEPQWLCQAGSRACSIVFPIKNNRAHCLTQAWSPWGGWVLWKGLTS